MALHLPAEHPDVSAGKSFYGPNRHPDLPGWEACWKDTMPTCWRWPVPCCAPWPSPWGSREDFFDRRFEQPVSVFRLIHYPPASARQSADQPGAGAHTDYGCVTLLYQGRRRWPAVQNRQGEWIDAPPIGSTFVVNIGDMMARWSNDRYRSTPHRVISPRGVHRYSMPFFARTHMDTEIRCLPAASTRTTRRSIRRPPVARLADLALRADPCLSARRNGLSRPSRAGAARRVCREGLTPGTG